MHLPHILFPRKRGKLSREMHHLPISIKLISLTMMIYAFGWAIVTPFLPIYYKNILGDYSSVGIIVALFSFFSAIWSLPVAALISKYSKRKLLKIIFILYFPFSIILLTLKTLKDFIFFNIYHSLLATPVWLSSEAYLRKHSPKRKATLSISFFDFAYYSVLIIGPIIGGILIFYIGFNIIYAISIFAFIAFLLSFKLPGRRKGKLFEDIINTINLQHITKELSDFITNKDLKKIAIINFFLIFCISFSSLMLPLLLKHYGASYLQIGLIYSAFYIPFFFEPYFATRENKRNLLLIGLGTASILFAMLFVASNILFIAAIIVLLSLTLSAISPIINGKITELMPKHEVEGLTGVLKSLSYIAAGFGPLFSGVIADAFGLEYIFLVGSLIFFILIYISGRIRFED